MSSLLSDKSSLRVAFYFLSPLSVAFAGSFSRLNGSSNFSSLTRWNLRTSLMYVLLSSTSSIVRAFRKLKKKTRKKRRSWGNGAKERRREGREVIEKRRFTSTWSSTAAIESKGMGWKERVEFYWRIEGVTEDYELPTSRRRRRISSTLQRIREIDISKSETGTLTLSNSRIYTVNFRPW